MARNFFSLYMSFVFEVNSKLKDSNVKLEYALQRMLTLDKQRFQMCSGYNGYSDTLSDSKGIVQKQN